MKGISVSECYRWYAERMEIEPGSMTKEDKQMALLEYILEKKHIENDDNE